MTVLAAVLAAVSLAGAGSPDRLSGPDGAGAEQVWVLRPAGPVRRVVVFAHGWKHAPPSPSYPWVGQFRPWLDHLAARGSAVIFPRYQLGIGDSYDGGMAADFEAGVRRGFAELGRPRVPVVAVGYSVGAALVLTYGAEARSWRLPVPVAVDAVFPAGPVPGVSLPPLPSRVRVLIQVGDSDTSAGSGGARAFWAWLRPHRRKTYEVVRSHGAFLADHAAPKLVTPAGRAAFWAPLDRLIAG